jgi:hypothetical protein
MRFLSRRTDVYRNNSSAFSHECADGRINSVVKGIRSNTSDWNTRNVPRSLLL